MKVSCAIIFAMLAVKISYALPVGNPAEASIMKDGLFREGVGFVGCFDIKNPCISWSDAFSGRLGFYGDYVFNRHLRINTPNDGFGDDGHVIARTQIYTNAAYLVFNILNRVDFFSTLGSTHFIVDAFNNFDTIGALQAESDSQFSWSIGGRASLWRCGCIAIGMEAQYFCANTNLARLTADADFSIYPDNSFRQKYSEWQVGWAITRPIYILAPYLGVKYAGANWEFNDSVFPLPDFLITPGTFKAAKHWGYVIGTSIVGRDIADLTIEGRFADEKALYINGQMRF